MRDSKQGSLAPVLALIIIAVIPRHAAANSVDITAPAPNSKATFSTATPGVKDVSCTATTVPSSLSPYWLCPTIPQGSTVSWPGENGNSGKSVTLRLTGLPNNNAGLGDFPITARVPSGCPGTYVSDSVTIHLFFPATASNHPGGVTPNWYYYWTQALGNGPHGYDAGTPDRGYTTLEGGAAVIYIGPGAYVTDDSLERHPGVKYINAFGCIVSHEQWHQAHRTHNLALHGGWNPPGAIDVDGDGLCGEWEAMIGTNPNNPSTYGIPDTEWGAALNETVPNAGSVDWANEGSHS